MILKNVTIEEELFGDGSTVLSMKVPEKLDQNLQSMIDSDLELQLTINMDGSYVYSIDTKGDPELGVRLSRILLDRINDSMDTLEIYLVTKYKNVLSLDE